MLFHAFSASNVQELNILPFCSWRYKDIQRILTGALKEPPNHVRGRGSTKPPTTEQTWAHISNMSCRFCKSISFRVARFAVPMVTNIVHSHSRFKMFGPTRISTDAGCKSMQIPVPQRTVEAAFDALDSPKSRTCSKIQLFDVFLNLKRFQGVKLLRHHS